MHLRINELLVWYILVKEKQKTVKDFSISKCNLLFAILGLYELELLRGLYLKLETSFWKVSELIVIYILSKTKFK